MTRHLAPKMCQRILVLRAVVWWSPNIKSEWRRGQKLWMWRGWRAKSSQMGRGDKQRVLVLRTMVWWNFNIKRWPGVLMCGGVGKGKGRTVDECLMEGRTKSFQMGKGDKQRVLVLRIVVWWSRNIKMAGHANVLRSWEWEGEDGRGVLDVWLVAVIHWWKWWWTVEVSWWSLKAWKIQTNLMI